MVIDKLGTLQYCNVSNPTDQELHQLDPYYSHICANIMGVGRKPLPVAVFEGDIEAIHFLEKWIDYWKKQKGGIEYLKANQYCGWTQKNWFEI